MIDSGAPTAASSAPHFPSGCGDPGDHDTLWEAVKYADPKHPGPNEHFPEQNKCGYAIRNGDNDTVKGPHNQLFIPTARITGIECPKLLTDASYLNFWHYAWQKATALWSHLDVMLGINSAVGRSHNQLHIHLTGFYKPARDSLPANVKDVSKWNDPGSVIALPTKPKPGQTAKPYVYRIAHVDSLDGNLFSLLKKFVVGQGDDMFQQALGVVRAPGGFYLINTEGKPESGERRQSSDLRMGNEFGTQTVEGLMDRG